MDPNMNNKIKPLKNIDKQAGKEIRLSFSTRKRKNTEVSLKISSISTVVSTSMNNTESRKCSLDHDSIERKSPK
jgi:hypothetical protein